MKKMNMEKFLVFLEKRYKKDDNTLVIISDYDKKNALANFVDRNEKIIIELSDDFGYEYLYDHIIEKHGRFATMEFNSENNSKEIYLQTLDGINIIFRDMKYSGKKWINKKTKSV